MFDAIKENKSWFLCIKDSRVIKFVPVKIEKSRGYVTYNLYIPFKTKDKAKKCAVSLNKKYWTDFNESGGILAKMKKKTAAAMSELIVSHLE